MAKAYVTGEAFLNFDVTYLTVWLSRLADSSARNFLTLSVNTPAGEGGRVALGGEESTSWVTLRQVHTASRYTRFPCTVLQ